MISRYPVSLPDAYCLATAKHTRSSLTSFDHKVIDAARNEGLETA
jgi:predicted nucleic acid-binding protein